MTKSKAAFGDWLKEQRESLGMTQAQFAVKCKMKQPDICRVELGKDGIGFGRAQAIADALGLSVTEIIEKFLNVA